MYGRGESRDALFRFQTSRGCFQLGAGWHRYRRFEKVTEAGEGGEAAADLGREINEKPALGMVWFGIDRNGCSVQCGWALDCEGSHEP